MPTLKHKKAFKAVLNGAKTISEAMRQAGYSESAQKTTGKLTRTAGWQELMRKHLPDSQLAIRHRELLDKREVVIVNEQHVDEEGDVRTIRKPLDVGPAVQAVSKALDMGYRLKGRYEAGSPPPQIGLMLTDAQVERIIRAREEDLALENHRS